MDTSTGSNDYLETDKKCEYYNDDQKFTDDEYGQHLLFEHTDLCRDLVTEKNKENLQDQYHYECTICKGNMLSSAYLRKQRNQGKMFDNIYEMRSHLISTHFYKDFFEKSPFVCPVTNCRHKFNSTEDAEKFFLDHFVIHHRQFVDKVIKQSRTFVSI